jgi:hypothetical protein
MILVNITVQMPDILNELIIVTNMYVKIKLLKFTDYQQRYIHNAF